MPLQGEDLSTAEARATEALLRARAQRYAGAERVERTVVSTVITFLRGTSRYAIALTDLCEIRALSTFCALPGADRAVPGVVHYRGELLSVVDLTALTTEQTPTANARWVLVSEHAGERLGLMADEVLDVLDLEVASVHALPLTLGAVGELFRGATAEGVLVVDAPHLFRAPQAMQLP